MLKKYYDMDYQVPSGFHGIEDEHCPLFFSENNIQSSLNYGIKLDNYPYNQYGSIRGKVTSISLATNQQTFSERKEKINAYLVNVSLQNGLKTNYGTELNFHSEAKGSAEIITDDKRLINRFFDNLKYKVK